MPAGTFPVEEQGTNLLSVLVNVAFGFVAGLMLFIGYEQVLAYGTKLANDLVRMSPQGAQMEAYGIAANYAPYVLLAPIGAIVLRELASVRSVKTFSYFAGAVLAGLVLAFLTQGKLMELMRS